MNNKKLQNFINNVTKLLAKKHNEKLFKLKRDLVNIKHFVKDEEVDFIFEIEKLSVVIERTIKVTMDIEKRRLEEDLNTEPEPFKGWFIDGEALVGIND